MAEIEPSAVLDDGHAWVGGDKHGFLLPPPDHDDIGGGACGGGGGGGGGVRVVVAAASSSDVLLTDAEHGCDITHAEAVCEAAALEAQLVRRAAAMLPGDRLLLTTAAREARRRALRY